MKLHIITTGGTIDKIYFDDKSDYQVGEPQISQILHAMHVAFDFEVTALMRKDSLHITDKDRQLIRATVEASSCGHILITHGTDTLAYTSAALCYALEGLAKPVILTGSMLPLTVEGSDLWAASAAAGVEARVTHHPAWRLFGRVSILRAHGRGLSR